MNQNRSFYFNIIIIYIINLLILLPLFGSRDELIEIDTNSDTIKIGTYNIRIDAKADAQTLNSWEQRKIPLSDLIKNYQFEIFGTQEGTNLQLVELTSLLEGFKFISNPYGGPYGLSHNNAIFYKDDIFKPLDTGVFWLSETPNIPSIGWNSSDQRICQWVKFKHKPSGTNFYFFNLHNHWRPEDENAKHNSILLAIEKIKEISGDSPVIFVGDFNSQPDTSHIKRLKVDLNDAFDVTQAMREGPENTNLGGGNFTGEPLNRIDYIFVSKDITVLNYSTHADKYEHSNFELRYPSDHLPISSTILMNQLK